MSPAASLAPSPGIPARLSERRVAGREVYRRRRRDRCPGRGRPHPPGSTGRSTAGSRQSALGTPQAFASESGAPGGRAGRAEGGRGRPRALPAIPPPAGYPAGRWALARALCRHPAKRTRAHSCRDQGAPSLGRPGGERPTAMMGVANGSW